jgi:hypothetical protein
MRGELVINYGELGESSLFAMENEERARYLLWRMRGELVINYGE